MLKRRYFQPAVNLESVSLLTVRSAGIPGREIQTTDDFGEADFRKHHPRFQDDNLRQNLSLLKIIEEIAKEKSCTPAQLALAWLLGQGNDIVPIPGTKRIKYLEENAASVDLKITVDELNRLNEALPPGVASGPRYHPQGMKAING